MERSVAEIVQSVTGESDADAARSKISSDPNCAELLRSRLSELSATLDGTHSQEANASNSATIHELETRLSDQINALSANVDQARADQNQAAVQLRQQADDTATAKTTLDRIGSPSSLPSITATLLSVAMVLGFFGSLGFIVSDRFDPTADTAKLQIVNIVIGALTAGFATVINFWLGSSQGSKNKDLANFSLQHIHALQAGRNTAPS